MDVSEADVQKTGSQPMQLPFLKREQSDPGNYRPVSLTWVTSKLLQVLESFIQDIVVKHMTLDRQWMYSECQHGFRKQRCITQLLLVTEDLTKFSEDGHSIDIVYLDF